MAITKRLYEKRTSELERNIQTQYGDRQKYIKIKNGTPVINQRKVVKAEQQVDYQVEYIKRRKADSAMVNKFYDIIDAQFTNICLWINDDEAIIDDVIVSTLQNVFDAIRRYPDLLLDVAWIFPDPPDSIKQALDLPNLMNPDISVVESAFTYDQATDRFYDIKYRYLVNMNGQLIFDYNEKQPVTKNVEVNAKLFLKLANQSRWNNLWTQCFASLCYHDNVSQAKATKNTNLNLPKEKRTAYELLTLQTITYILKYFEDLPFTFRSNHTIDIHYVRQSWGTCVVPLLYSLLELSKEEKGCNVSPTTILPMILYRIKAAYTSFETETLNQKGIYSTMLKYLTSKVGKHVRVALNDTCTIHTLTVHARTPELFLDGEELKLFQSIQSKCDPLFLQVIDSHLPLINTSNHAKNTETLRWLCGNCLIMGNAGIYYKTALSLETVASVESRIGAVLDYPKPKKYWVMQQAKVVLENDWNTGNPVWKEVFERYSKMCAPFLNIFDSNLEEYFFSLLTNRSQGFKVDITNFATTNAIPDKLLKQIKNVGQVRIASFLLANEVFHVYPLYLEELRKDGVCTIRYQNNRRARIVEIVPNVDQIAYALVLKMFEELKQEYDDIAVGKQIGGIVDMTTQLQVSGTESSVSIFSDVSAMDAHTQPNVSLIFLQILSQLLANRQIGPEHYFPFRKMKVQVVSGDRETGIYDSSFADPGGAFITFEELPAEVQALLIVSVNRMEKQYHLKDDILNRIILINSSIFESGRFDTGAQHTSLLKIKSDIVDDKLFLDMPLYRALCRIKKLVFGDDFFQAIMGLHSFEDQQKLISHLVMLSTATDPLFGLKSETELSRFYGDFLQQTALCGCALPKSARASIYTDERSSLITRSPIDLITNMANIITAAAQRTYAPTNVMPLVRSIWLLNNTVQLISKTKITLPNRLTKYVKNLHNKTYLTYPYITISLSPLNFPNQTMVLDGGVVFPKTSWCRTVGMSKYLWIWNEVISDSGRLRIFQTERDVQENKTYFVDPYSIIEEELGHTDIIPALTLLQFQRAQRLSKNRQDELKDVIEPMGKRASNYFNRIELQKSAVSSIELKQTYGIKVPDALSYHRRPFEQLNNMFSSRAETTDESQQLGFEFTRFLCKQFKTPHPHVRSQFNNSCVFFTKHTSTVPLCPQFSEYPLLPGYWNGSDYSRLISVVGDALTAPQRKNKSILSFQSRYAGAFDLGAIQRIGMQAKQKGNNALKLFFEVLNLPKKIENSIKQMLEFDSSIIMDDLYSSGFQPDQNFAISDSIKFVVPRLELPPASTSNVSATLQIMLRDYLFLSIHNDILQTKWGVHMAPPVLGFFKIKHIGAQIGVSVR